MFIFLDPGFRMIKIKFANIQIQPKPLELPLQKKKKRCHIRENSLSGGHYVPYFRTGGDTDTQWKSR